MLGPASKFRFGSFELDCASRELRKHGLRLKLEDQSIRLLVALVQRHGEIVDRDTLKSELWAGDTYGDFDRGLTRAINRLRTALGDSAANPLFLETLHRRGYRFVAPVSELNGDLHAPPGESTTLAASPQATLPRSRWAAAGLVVLIISLATGALLLSRRAPSPLPSVAILPFAVADSDATYSFMGDSLAESVTSNLSRLRSIRVLAFDSAWRINREKLSGQSAGRRLGVNTVLSGRLRPQDDRVVVGVELVQVEDNAQLWGKQYSVKSEDLPTLESEIARDVSRQLGSGQAEITQMESAHPRPRPEAYVEELRGRYEQRKRTPQASKAALDHFQRAAEIDSNFAGAWADIADIRFTQFFAAESSRQDYSKWGKEAAQRALKIDGSIGEAHAIIAAFRFHEDFDWARAETEFRHAIDLTPYSSSIHLRYSMMLLAMGRLAEALAVAGQAQKLDPLSPVFCSWKANVQFVSSNYPQAIEEGKTSLALDNNFGLGHLVLGRSYIQLGQHRESLQELVKAREVLSGNWRTLGDLAYTYGISGDPVKARSLLNDMMDRRVRASFPALPLALAHIGLADRDQAFVWLRKAIDERCSELWLKSDPRFATLRSDARFTELLRLMKLQ